MLGELDIEYLFEILFVVFVMINFYGFGYNWVKWCFISVVEFGQLVCKVMNVFNLWMQMCVDVVKYQVCIFGSYKENIYFLLEYIVELELIRDENKCKVWLWGDWDIVVGGVFDDVYKFEVYKFKWFKILKMWCVDCLFDWGLMYLFFVGWWVEVNGEEVILVDGLKFSLFVGMLICIYEWYGIEEFGMNIGFKMLVIVIVEGICEKDVMLFEQGWIVCFVCFGLVDNQICDVM